MKNGKTAKRWLAAAIGTAVVGVGLGFAVSQSGASSSSPPVPPPIQPAPAGTPADKASVWQRMEQARVAHAGSPVVPPAAPSTPLGTSVRLGITDDRQGPFTASQFSGLNSWSGVTGSTITVVVAGGKPSSASDPFNSPKLAAVFVYSEPVTPTAGGPVSTPIGVFAPSVDPTGEFSVAAVNGTTLTLAIPGSPGSYHFNVATSSFT